VVAQAVSVRVRSSAPFRFNPVLCGINAVPDVAIFDILHLLPQGNKALALKETKLC
jgi:hypothetical protein